MISLGKTSTRRLLKNYSKITENPVNIILELLEKLRLSNFSIILHLDEENSKNLKGKVLSYKIGKNTSPEYGTNLLQVIKEIDDAGKSIIDVQHNGDVYVTDISKSLKNPLINISDQRNEDLLIIAAAIIERG
jgi:hypothetical protein